MHYLDSQWVMTNGGTQNEARRGVVRSLSLGGVDGKVEGGKGVGRFPRLGEQDAPPESFVAEVTYGSAKN